MSRSPSPRPALTPPPSGPLTTGNRLGEAKVQFNLAALAEGQARYADMLGHSEQALRLYQAIGDKASEAGALNNVGWTHCLLGDYEQARAFCRQALALCTEVGHH